MSWPTFQQLRYLVAVADAGSFAAAADDEFVSQPALSTQIKELERKLGVTLFERSARGVMLTTPGDAVVERARIVLREMNDLIEASRYDGKNLHGRVALGVIPTLAPYVLPDVVKIFVRKHADSQLHIRELQTNDLLESLRHGDIDVGLLALPVPSREFDTAPVAEDKFVLAIPEGHKLARGKSPVSLEALRYDRVILLEEGHCLRDQAMEVCQLAISEPSEVQATSMPALVQMVAAGLGVTLLPECAVEVEASPGRGIAIRRFSGHAPRRTIGLVWRRTSPFADVYLEFARLLGSRLTQR